jgi:hypothetical protein
MIPVMEERRSTASDRTRPDGAVVRPAPQGTSALGKRAAFLGPVLLAAFLVAHHLLQAHALGGFVNADDSYDDGAYFGAAVRFAYGVIPYRDFTFPQPPGSFLLLAPIGLLSHVVGSAAGLAAARCLTGLACVCNVALAGRLVRRRGAVAVFTAGTALAVFPFTAYVDASARVDPYLVAFCLIGLNLLSHVRLTRRRVVLAGLALGFASTVKLWAGPVILAALLVLAWRRRPLVAPLAAGVVLGAAAPCLPFLVASPSNFLREVVVDQLTRTPPPHGATFPIVSRLLWIGGMPSLPNGLGLAMVILVSVLVVVAFRWDRCHLDLTSWLCLAAGAMAFFEMALSPEFYTYYPYFPAALLAPLLGVSAAHFVAAASAALRRRHAAGGTGAMAAGVWVAAVVLAAGLFFLPESMAFPQALRSTSPGPMIASHVPRAACTVTDEPTLLLEAGRFESPAPRCAQFVDPFGMYLAYDRGHPPPGVGPYPELESLWRQALRRADAVVLMPTRSFIPWTPPLRRWFGDHFRLVARDRDADVFRRVR